jgi:hypothetical protein
MTDSVLGLNHIATRCLVVGRQCARDPRARGRFQRVVSLARVMSKFPLCLKVRHEHR